MKTRRSFLARSLAAAGLLALHGTALAHGAAKHAGPAKAAPLAAEQQEWGIAGDPAAFEKQNESFFKDVEKVNKSIKLLRITVGEKDFALTGSKRLAELFQKHGIKHEFQLTGGGHTWINWRQYLNELAPRLFQ